MKDRTREAIFNLIGAEAKRKRHAIDLFAGTGALAIEALSRGASTALLIERHVPTARIVAENLAALDLESRSTLLTTSAFLWGRRDLAASVDAGSDDAANPPTPQDRTVPPKDLPWLVFCSPPYAFYRERWDDLERLLAALGTTMPEGSFLVVEADAHFDFEALEPVAPLEAWKVRTYAPAVVGVWRKSGE